MSKGSKPRPFSVTDHEYATRWDAIFGRDTQPKYEADEGALTNEQLAQITAGAEINSGDGGYSVGTQEKCDEFVKTRNMLKYTGGW